MLRLSAEAESPAVKYVILDWVLKAASDAGDYRTALVAVGKLDETFDVDGYELAADVLTTVRLSADQKKENQEVARLGEGLMQLAAKNDKYSQALRLGPPAVRAARRIEEYDAVKRIEAEMRKIRTLQTIHDEAQQAIETLKNSPDDGEANTTAGRYFCFAKEDWKKGLRLLALGDNDALAQVSRLDRQDPQEGEARLAVADGWFDAAEAEPSWSREAAFARAAHWYRQALDDLSVLDRTKAEKRLEQIEERE